MQHSLWILALVSIAVVLCVRMFLVHHKHLRRQEMARDEIANYESWPHIIVEDLAVCLGEPEDNGARIAVPIFLGPESAKDNYLEKFVRHFDAHKKYVADMVEVQLRFLTGYKVQLNSGFYVTWDVARLFARTSNRGYVYFNYDQED